jgi:hypothetical protein
MLIQIIATILAVFIGYALGWHNARRACLEGIEQAEKLERDV